MKSKWKSQNTAPKDGNPIIADIGLPWAVLACWSTAEQKWCYTNLQMNMVNGEDDPYFENEWEPELKAWVSLPEIAISKLEFKR